jgi:hypothetical protein
VSASGPACLGRFARGIDLAALALVTMVAPARWARLAGRRIDEDPAGTGITLAAGIGVATRLVALFGSGRLDDRAHRYRRARSRSAPHIRAPRHRRNGSAGRLAVSEIVFRGCGRGPGRCVTVAPAHWPCASGDVA